jgi:hypothetical protein
MAQSMDVQCEERPGAGALTGGIECRLVTSETLSESDGLHLSALGSRFLVTGTSERAARGTP